MLSDHERKTLHEVERQFMAEDPEFAGSFRAREQRLPREPRLPRGRLQPVAKIGIVVAMLLSAIMLVTGSVSGALALAATPGLIWVTWRYSDVLARAGGAPDDQ